MSQRQSEIEWNRTQDTQAQLHRRENIHYMIGYFRRHSHRIDRSAFGLRRSRKEKKRKKEDKKRTLVRCSMFIHFRFRTWRAEVDEQFSIRARERENSQPHPIFAWFNTNNWQLENSLSIQFDTILFFSFFSMWKKFVQLSVRSVSLSLCLHPTLPTSIYVCLCSALFSHFHRLDEVWCVVSSSVVYTLDLPDEIVLNRAYARRVILMCSNRSLGILNRKHNSTGALDSW